MLNVCVYAERVCVCMPPTTVIIHDVSRDLLRFYVEMAHHEICDIAAPQLEAKVVLDFIHYL